MELWLNGNKKKSWTITNTSYKTFTWNGYWNSQCKIDVVYTNHYKSTEGSTALFVDWVKVNEVTEQAEGSRAEYDKGSYPDGCFDGENCVTGRQQLTETGALRFQFIDGLQAFRAITYDEENRMTKINDDGFISRFYYDAEGRRIKKVADGVTHYYFFNNYEEAVEPGVTTKQSTTMQMEGALHNAISPVRKIS